MTQKNMISREKKDHARTEGHGKPRADVRLAPEGFKATKRAIEYNYYYNKNLPIYCLDNPQCFPKFVKPTR